MLQHLLADCFDLAPNINQPIIWEYQPGDAEAFWECVLDDATDISDNPNSLNKLPVMEPPLHHSELVLAAGFLLAFEAHKWLQSNNEETRMSGFDMLLHSLKCWELWGRVRGQKNTRAPGEFWEKVKRSDRRFEKQMFEVLHRAAKSEEGKEAADKWLDQQGGYRAKAEKIKEAWRSGKYKTKTECARQECEVIGLSFRVAQQHLNGEP